MSKKTAHGRDSPGMDTGPPVERRIDMKNTGDICSVSFQLGKAAEQIGALACEIGAKDERITGDLAGVYEEILLDQIRQAQILMLKLTDLVTEMQEENADEEGGAFAEGELTSVLGSKEPEDSGEKEV